LNDPTLGGLNISRRIDNRSRRRRSRFALSLHRSLAAIATAGRSRSGAGRGRSRTTLVRTALVAAARLVAVAAASEEAIEQARPADRLAALVAVRLHRVATALVRMLRFAGRSRSGTGRGRSRTTLVRATLVTALAAVVAAFLQAEPRQDRFALLHAALRTAIRLLHAAGRARSAAILSAIVTAAAAAAEHPVQQVEPEALRTEAKAENDRSNNSVPLHRATSPMD